MDAHRKGDGDEDGGQAEITSLDQSLVRAIRTQSRKLKNRLWGVSQIQIPVQDWLHDEVAGR